MLRTIVRSARQLLGLARSRPVAAPPARPADAPDPKAANLHLCGTDGLWDEYFDDAEAFMAGTWAETVWPLIQDADFGTVLELAPGAGRNTEKLAAVAAELHAVDLNEYALRRLRKRFADYRGPCRLHVHKNDGTDLGMIADASITFVYCWDAAVHFDRAVVRDYVREFARVMRPGATGFVHHSDLGDAAAADLRKNPHWRSNVSGRLFAEFCRESGLEVVRQEPLPWLPPVDGKVISDCLSVFRKPGPAAPR